MRIIFSILFILFLGEFTAQTSSKYNSPYANFYRAEDLFLKEQYGAAREEYKLFYSDFSEKNDPLYIKARFYEGLAALELFQNDGVRLLEQFNRDYPESIYREMLFFRMGKFFYQKKDYPATIEWFNKLATADVEPENRDEFHFKLGYALYEEKQFEEAKKQFYEIRNSDSEYGSPALYYYSHLEYSSGSLQTALEGFNRLKNHPDYAKIVPSYIAQIYYSQGRYREIIEEADSWKTVQEQNLQKTLSGIVGNAYYRLQDYENALPLLLEYDNSVPSTRTSDYQIGYAYFKSKNYPKAITYFTKTAKGTDSLAHIATYQIGESYLALNDKLAARGAFEKAATLSADAQIAEDAAFQSAVLSYEVGLNPYDEALVAFEKYLKKYPQSSRKNEVYQYLVNVYSTTNNYDKALKSLDQIPNKDARMKSVYQLIAFNAGVEQFQKKNYTGAIQYFEAVNRFPIDETISAKAQFWTADALYRQNQYRKAIQGFRAFIPLGAGLPQLKADAYYNIGYAQLALRDTLQAIESFQLFSQQSVVQGTRKLADALMRVADGYYAIRQNDAAIENYRKVVKMKMGYEDQALHYLGKTLGFTNKLDEKIWAHQEILNNYPKSKYVQVAIQELAITYKIKGNFDQALKHFQQIISDYPQSTLVKESMIDIADIYYKKQEYLKAEAKYKEVLEKYSGDRSTCELVAKNLADIYRTMREPDRLQGIISAYPCANLSPDDQENLYYTPAYDLYRDSNWVAAIPQIQKYLNQYPQGKYANEMRVFLGNSHFELQQFEQAMAQYELVLQSPTTGYTEFVAQRVSKYQYNNAVYSKALPAYQKLEATSASPEVIFNAQVGVMRSAFLLKNYTLASEYGTKVLNSTKISAELKLEANYAKGISNYHLKEYNVADGHLMYVVKNTTTVLGAEAKYYQAKIAFDQKDYPKTDVLVRELLKMKPAYNFWIAQALLLQSRVLMIQENYFQAEQTIRSILDHYSIPDDGVIMEANQLMDELQQLVNQPKNITPEEKPIININGKN